MILSLLPKSPLLFVLPFSHSPYSNPFLSMALSTSSFQDLLGFPLFHRSYINNLLYVSSVITSYMIILSHPFLFYVSDNVFLSILFCISSSVILPVNTTRHRPAPILVLFIFIRHSGFWTICHLLSIIDLYILVFMRSVIYYPSLLSFLYLLR